MTRNRAVLLSILVLLILLAFLFSRVACQDDGSTHPARLTSGRAAATMPELKVGVYLSRYTADQIDGYSAQMTAQLVHRNLDLIPLLEPDAQPDPRLTKILSAFFVGKKSIDVTNVDELKKLDVIIAPRIWFLPDEPRKAIEAAVTNGTGLFLRDGFGCMEPGNDPDVSRVNGFEESNFGYNPHPMECEVIANHPILGKLTLGQTLNITPNGTWGKPLGKTIPLIRVKDMNAFRDFEHRGQDDWTFYPLYISELGKGRVIGCQFPAWEPMPKGLVAADSEFNLHCVLWLAHRLDSPGGTTTGPSTQAAIP